MLEDAFVPLNATLIGRLCWWLPTNSSNKARGLFIRCVCRDLRRTSFGRIDVLVAPVAGSGETWISEKNIMWQAPSKEESDASL